MNRKKTMGGLAATMAVLLEACPAFHEAALKEAPLNAPGEKLVVIFAKGGKQ
ncbi:MAG: hypothetical protein P8J87_11375 [Verrucomicrobiales bacterium]|nr:hypothetical protein [Verrucomicrobiales bacterium]